MPTGKYTITDIPADKVDTVIARFRLDNPQDVSKAEQQGGLWTVTAEFGGEGTSVKSFDG